MSAQTNNLSIPAASNSAFEIGLYSFAELTPDPHSGQTISPAQRLQELIESIELADQVGLDVMNKIGRERGWPGMTREQFIASCSLGGANYVGSPDDIIEKVLYQHELFGHQRLLLMLGVGTMPHDKLMHAIELLGTKVAPVVRKEIAGRSG